MQLLGLRSITSIPGGAPQSSHMLHVISWLRFGL